MPNIDINIEQVYRIAKNVFAFIGILSVLFPALQFLIKLLKPDKIYIPDVSIKTISDVYELNDELSYYDVFDHVTDVPADSFMIMPKGVDLKSVTFWNLKYCMKKNKLKKVSKIKSYDIVKNGDGILVNTVVPGGIHLMSVTWKSDYGRKGEFIFQENGFNGNSNTSSYQYSETPVVFVRKVLNIR